MIHVVFQGGPVDGEEMAMGGELPSYLMMLRNPIRDSSMEWIVVGAGFNDHWPGQLRYVRVERASDDELAVYRYVE
jgi:hypothetical protein